MKHFKRFVLLTVFMGIVLCLLTVTPATGILGEDSEALLQHYQAVWANEINEKGILLYLNGEKILDSVDGVRMSERMVLMAETTLLNDIFRCTVASFGENRIGISNLNGEVLVFDVNEGLLQVEDGWTDTDAIVCYEDGSVGISVEFLAEYLGYTYNWDNEENGAWLYADATQYQSLPSYFDLREQGRVSSVRDQGSWATCWAFAALSALESSLLPQEEWQFAVDHLVLSNGFHLSIDDGGDYNMALAYLASWQGPVTEEEDPYGDGKTIETEEVAVHLQEAVIINEKDYEQIKLLIYEYGAVQSAIYSLPDIRELDDYYNAACAAYYYPETMDCNHDIVIIGWDDNYPKENFATEPEGDGAFICKNSWGADFGIDGYFYISYYDKNIGVTGIAYTVVESSDNYDKLYQSDLLGWTGSIGYGGESAWFANVYEAESDEEIAAVGFYATDSETWYDIYLVRDFETAEDLTDREWIQSGYLADKGFYTVEFLQSQMLTAGEKFAIVIEIDTRNSSHPIAIEYTSGELTSGVDISDGESYMSHNGRTWSRLEEVAECNACLKVYVNESSED